MMRHPHSPNKSTLKWLLLAAVERGNVSNAATTIDEGADINVMSNNGETPLIIAVRRNDVRMVRMLLRYHPDLNATSSNDETPLLIAAGIDNPKIVKALVQAHADLEIKNADGATALFVAAANGLVGNINILLHAGADIDTKDRYDDTPLTIATRKYHLDAVKALVQAKANVDIRNLNHKSALYFALQSGNREMIQVLLDGSRKFKSFERNGIADLIKSAEEMDKEEEAKLVASSIVKESPPVEVTPHAELEELALPAEEPNAESSTGLLSKFLGLFAPKNKTDVRAISKDVKLENVLQFK